MKIKKSPLLFAVNLLRHQIKMLKSGVADCIDDCHKFTDFYLLICAYLYGLFFIMINGMKSSGKKRDNSGSIGRLLGGMCNSIAEYATKKEGIQPSFFAVVSLTLVNPF